MDDVIERMAKAIADEGSPFSAGPNTNEINQLHIEGIRQELLTALRAVSDTHRLVPIEPSDEMCDAGFENGWCVGDLVAISKAIDAAPDYTEAEDG